MTTLKFIATLWLAVALVPVATVGVVLLFASFFFDGTSLATSKWHYNLAAFAAGLTMLSISACGARAIAGRLAKVHRD